MTEPQQTNGNVYRVEEQCEGHTKVRVVNDADTALRLADNNTGATQIYRNGKLAYEDNKDDGTPMGV